MRVGAHEHGIASRIAARHFFPGITLAVKLKVPDTYESFRLQRIETVARDPPFRARSFGSLKREHKARCSARQRYIEVSVPDKLTYGDPGNIAASQKRRPHSMELPEAIEQLAIPLGERSKFFIDVVHDSPPVQVLSNVGKATVYAYTAPPAREAQWRGFWSTGRTQRASHVTRASAVSSGHQGGYTRTAVGRGPL